MCLWEACVFCCYWTECSRNKYQVTFVDSAVQIIYILPCILLTYISVAEKYVSDSRYNCGFIYFTFQIYQFFFHVGWKSLLCKYTFVLLENAFSNFLRLAKIWDTKPKPPGIKLKNQYTKLYKIIKLFLFKRYSRKFFPIHRVGQNIWKHTYLIQDLYLHIQEKNAQNSTIRVQIIWFFANG